MMPPETPQAVEWALAQTDEIGRSVSEVYRDEVWILVDKVREYFNEHHVAYSTFSFEDLLPYLPL